MSFLKDLFSPTSQAGTFYTYSVRCKRCGEIIRGQVNVYNDPSIEEDEKGKSFYSCRKVLIGSGHCFQPVEVLFKFDASKKIIDRQIVGGEFIDA